MPDASSFQLSTGKPVGMFSHKRKSSRECHSEKKVSMQNIKTFGNSVLEIQSDRAVPGEQEALCKLSEAEIHTKILHEEQKKSNTLRGTIQITFAGKES